MSFENDAEVPEHSHEQQWEFVLDGEIQLTIRGVEYTFKKGNTYFIPQGVMHGAKIKKGYKDITLINQKDRYQIKVVNEKMPSLIAILTNLIPNLKVVDRTYISTRSIYLLF